MEEVKIFYLFYNKIFKTFEQSISESGKKNV